MKTRLLDLFSGAGGCARGYQNAGFYVVGVDIEPQPRYCGDEFVQADALEYLAQHGHEFDVIHAGPPCQAYCKAATSWWPEREWPDLIPATQEALRETGKPYVIENVPGAPLRNPLLLCGTMFPPLKIVRHRLFECNPPIWFPPYPCSHNYGGMPIAGRGTK